MHRPIVVMTLLRMLSMAIIALAARQAVAQQSPSAATRVAQAVNSAVYQSDLQYLADDLLEGRAPGTRGGILAAKFIATQFKQLGLEPAGDSGTYFHRVPIISLNPTPTLQAAGGSPLAYKQDFVLWSMRDTASVSVRGEAVFVGYGIVAPEYQWNDYAGQDVKGKIVVALVNDPGLRDSTIFRGRVLTYYGRWTYKIEEAARQGAAGILLLHTDEGATYTWGTVNGSWTGPQVRIERPATSLVVAGWLSQQGARALLGIDDVPALIATAAARSFKPASLGVTLEASVESVIRRSSTDNVLARLPGKGPLADQAVFISAHYDHLGIGLPVAGDSIYNGAADNASGTAAMLAAADAFVRSGVRTGRSVVFMGVAAEEAGLLGSQAYVQSPTIPLKRVAAVLNMDVMNMLGPTKDIAALGVDLSSLGPVFTQAAAAQGLRVTTNQDALIRGSFFRSDHFPFARGGVPGLSIEPGSDFVGQPAGWGQKQREEYTATRYHRPQDELPAAYNPAGAIQQIRVVVRTAVALADQKAMPTWNPGSEFQAAGEARFR